MMTAAHLGALSENNSSETDTSDGAADLNHLDLLPCRMREYLTLLLEKKESSSENKTNI